VVHGDRLVVDVDDPRRGVAPLRDLVHVADGRDAGAEVEELADTLVHQELHATAQPRAVDRGDLPHPGRDLLDLAGEGPVRLEVVRATQVEVVHPGGVGLLEVEVTYFGRRLRSHGGEAPFDMAGWGRAYDSSVQLVT
jgi:hypothetical protein